jgi:putative acyl-CoA dehydrogenase
MIDWLMAQRGRNAVYDIWMDGIDLKGVTESTARLFVERLALAAQAATLLEWESPLADAFCTLRLASRGAAYGAFEAVIDTDAILRRALPLG